MAALRLDTLLSLRHLWAERLEFPITCEVCWRRCRPARRSLQAEQGGLSVLRVLRHICLYVARSPMSGGGLPWGDLLRQAAWCYDPKTPHCLCPICPFHTTHTPRRARARMAGGLQRKTPVPHPCTGASPLPLALRQPGSGALQTLGLLAWTGLVRLQAPLQLSRSSFWAQPCWLRGALGLSSLPVMMRLPAPI